MSVLSIAVLAGAMFLAGAWCARAVDRWWVRKAGECFICGTRRLRKDAE